MKKSRTASQTHLLTKQNWREIYKSTMNINQFFRVINQYNYLLKHKMILLLKMFATDDTVFSTVILDDNRSVINCRLITCFSAIICKYISII